MIWALFVKLSFINRFFFFNFSIEYVDSLPTILVFMTHYLWNSTTELILLCRPLGNFFSSRNEWRDKKSRLTVSGRYWYRIPIFKRTYQYILLFPLFFDVEKKSETYTLTQIDMQTCYVILPYICKFPQLPKMRVWHFFQSCWICDLSIALDKQNTKKEYWILKPKIFFVV